MNNLVSDKQAADLVGLGIENYEVQQMTSTEWRWRIEYAFAFLRETYGLHLTSDVICAWQNLYVFAVKKRASIRDYANYQFSEKVGESSSFNYLTGLSEALDIAIAEAIKIHCNE